jgi:predicted alpha/beta-hydrolase family hydrolase
MKPFVDESRSPAVRGFWHDAIGDPRGVLVLTHGAGSNAAAPLLVEVAEAFAGEGYAVLRCDLPFRQARPHGPPFPAHAANDRAGLENAVMSARGRGPTFLGGHSYGGRQASMLAAEKPGLVDALLLLSYPLHPPRRPTDLRTGHFPSLRTPALFVHGARDPFGSLGELRDAIALIPGRTELVDVARAGHDLRAMDANTLPGRLAGLVSFGQPG